MGKFADKYREYSKEVNRLDQNVPDRGAEHTAYVEQQAQLRKAKRRRVSIQSAVRSARPTFEQVQNAINKVFDEKTRNKFDFEVNDKMRITMRFRNYFQAHPELLQALTPQQQKIIESGSRNAVSSLVEELRKSGKLPEEEYLRVQTGSFLTQAFNENDEMSAAFVEAIEGTFTPEQTKAAEGYLESYVDPTDVPENEQVSHPYETRVNELKAGIPENIKNDPEKLERYQAALDFAASHLTRVHSDVKSEKCAYEADVQGVQTGRSNYLVNENIATYQNGKYNNVQDTKVRDAFALVTAKPGREQDYEDLLNDKIHMSDATKSGIRRIIQKMEEMKLLDYPYAANGEDGDKIFAHNKMFAEKKELIRALNEGDPDKIIEAKEKYEKTWSDMQELYDIARESFSQDTAFFTGNIDGTRNGSLSWEFTGDVMTTAQVNQVFLIHMKLKQNGRSLEDYLENPTKGVVDGIVNQIGGTRFEEKTKGLSLDKCMDKLLRAPDEVEDLQRKMSYGTGRAILGPALLEKDDAIKTGNLIYSSLLDKQAESIFFGQIYKYEYLQQPDTPEGRIAQQTTLENLVLVTDADRNLNALLGGLPESDSYGRILNPPFDQDEYIRTHPADYEAMIDRAEVVLGKCNFRDNDLRDFISSDTGLEAIQNIFSKVLLAHQADRGTPGYDHMEDVYMSLISKLSLHADPDRRQRMEANLSNYTAAKEKYFEDKMASRPEDSLDTLVQRGNDAKRGVFFGSGEYDKAVDAVTSLRDTCRELTELGPDASEADRRQKMEEIREKATAAKEKINKYFERKRNQGKMGPNADAKSRKRIGVMKDSMDSIMALAGQIDDKLAVMEQKELEAENKAAANDLIDVIETNYTIDAMAADGIDKLGIDGARKALINLKDISMNRQGPLTQQEERMTRVTMAAMVFNEMLATPAGEEIRSKMPQNMDTYRAQVRSIADSKAFKDAMPNPLTRDEIRNFIADKNAPKEMMNRFGANRMAENNQRKQEEPVKAPVRGRSKSVHVRGPEELNKEQPKPERPSAGKVF